MSDSRIVDGLDDEAVADSALRCWTTTAPCQFARQTDRRSNTSSDQKLARLQRRLCCYHVHRLPDISRRDFAAPSSALAWLAEYLPTDMGLDAFHRRWLAGKTWSPPGILIDQSLRNLGPRATVNNVAIGIGCRASRSVLSLRPYLRDRRCLRSARRLTAIGNPKSRNDVFAVRVRSTDSECGLKPTVHDVGVSLVSLGHFASSVPTFLRRLVIR